MALRPTIYKCSIALSDLDREVYDSLSFTVAQHPSETPERMMVRILAFCLNAQERLVFSKGLSNPEEPDLWLHGLDNQLLEWIEVGEPSFDRIKKATRIAKSVRVYTFNSKSDVWWQQEQAAFSGMPVHVTQFPWASIQQLNVLVERGMDFSVTISGATLYISSDSTSVEVPSRVLQTL